MWSWPEYGFGSERQVTPFRREAEEAEKAHLREAADDKPNCDWVDAALLPMDV